jgi:hypothetical protein
MAELFETLADLAASGYVFRIVDNGGSSADRYTAIFSDGDYLAMSTNPSHPQGVGLTGEGIDLQGVADRVEAGEEVDLALGDCPEAVQRCILGVVNQGWADFLDAGEAGEPSAVAPNREAAKTFEGLHNQAGVGIYRARDGLRVKDDNSWGAADPEGEDPGPFETFAEAFKRTLPEDYSLAGPEYHSGENVARLEPSPETAERVAALEAKADAEWRASRKAENPFFPD